MTRKAKKILIVEDDPASLYALKSILQDRGNEVIPFSNAEDARKWEGELDAAIIDVRLPGISGTALAKHLMAGRPDLKVVMVTAYDGLEEISAALPGVKVLLKPLVVSEMVELL